MCPRVCARSGALRPSARAGPRVAAVERQAAVELLAALSRLTFLGTQMIISGDFNQFAPLSNAYRGQAVGEDVFARSRLLHTMAGGNRLHLTECKRSDDVLFRFYTRLIPGGDLFGLPVATAVAQPRNRFTYKGMAELNLVLSHRKRVQLNKQCNLHFRPAAGAPQPMWVWVGQKLFGCLPIERQGIRNGVEYTVSAVDTLSVTLENGPALTHEQAVAWLRLPYAMTYASVQGRETEGTLCLHDCSNCHMSLKHLYVGLSRAKRASGVRVE